MAIMFDIGIPEPILYYKLLQLAKYDDVYVYDAYRKTIYF